MTGFVTTYTGYVMPAQCDSLGHMNLQFYFGAIGDGMFALQTRLGLGPKAVRDRGLSFAVVHAESDFKAELHAGDVIRLDSAILELGNRTATFRHRLMRIEDEALTFTCLFTTVLFDTRARRAVEIPDDIRAAAAPYLVEDDPG